MVPRVDGKSPVYTLLLAHGLCHRHGYTTIDSLARTGFNMRVFLQIGIAQWGRRAAPSPALSRVR